MIRTFLAVELPRELSSQVGQLQQELKQRFTKDTSRIVRLSWVQPASIHLTMKFLGDVNEQLIAPMKEAIEQAVQGHGSISIPLERLGVFPRAQQPKVLWLGPSEQWEQGVNGRRFTALHQAIEARCRLLDFAPENRPLTPHLTVARIREGERHMGQILTGSGVTDRPLSLGSLPVESIVLIRSELHPTGSRYTKLWEVRLDAFGLRS